MKKHLSTIIGVVLALGVAFAAFVWDNGSRNDRALQSAHLLHSMCVEGRRSATGAPVTQDFPECARHYDAHWLAQDARMTSSALFGAGVGAGFALLFFGGRWLRRRRRDDAAAA